MAIFYHQYSINSVCCLGPTPISYFEEIIFTAMAEHNCEFEPTQDSCRKKGFCDQ